MIALSSCKSIEIAHNPIGCIEEELTRLSERFTDSELNSISDRVFDVYEQHIYMYQQRILTQCELNQAHDKLHSKG